jgi:electron transport complex protein RnfC
VAHPLHPQHFTGGISLAASKDRSTARPIEREFVPTQVAIALLQHQGEPATAVVHVGERVLRGQTVAVAAAGSLSAAVHASTSGWVRATEERLVLTGNGLLRSPCLVIEADGLDEAVPRNIASEWPIERADRLAAMRAGGIVGLGGAAYPTADKLAPPVPCETLIINGAECEPYISCDDALMREHAREVMQGALIIADVLGAGRCIVAIEHDKPEALAAIGAAIRALDAASVTLAEVPTLYPAGGERQLIELLTGRALPSGRYPSELGYLCHNVGTAFAVQRLAVDGEPLSSRVVTVTGGGVREPRNVLVPLGTPVAELIARCGGYTEGVVRLIAGGSMMGYALPDDDLPITKATNCILAATAAEVRTDRREWPCIRCGECAAACPARLLPQDLLIAARTADIDALRALRLADCIECGCCDVVCPSHIPLTERFRIAKRSRSTTRAVPDTSHEL